MSQTESHDGPTKQSAIGENLIMNGAILDSIPDAIITTDMDFRITGWNRAAETIYGWQANEVVGKTLGSVLPTDYVNTTVEEVMRQFTTYGSWSGDVVQQHKNGKSIDIMASVTLVKDSQGQPAGIIGVYRNITERKQTEQALQASELRYRAIFDNSPDGILIADVESRHLIYANPSICQMLGYSVEELLTLGVEDIHPPDQLRHVIAQFEAQARGEIHIAPEIPCLKKDGTIFYVDVRTTAAVIDDVLCNVGFFHDVTLRRQTEHELRKLSEAVEQSANCVVITDVSGNIDYVNPKFCDLTGYSREEVYGQNPRILKSGYTPLETYKTLWNTILSGQPWRGEFLNRKKNGDLWWELASIFPIHDTHGTIINFVAVKEDITDLKRINDILRESEERYRRVAEMIADYAYMHQVLDDGSLHLVWIVGDLAAITGFTQAESEARGGWAQLIHQEDIPVAMQRAEKLLAGTPDVSEFRIVCANGEIRWLRDHGYPVWDADQERVVQIYGAAQDITASKYAEQTLIESEQRYRQLIENLHNGVIVCAPDTSIILHNERAFELLGPENKYLFGKRVDELALQFIRSDGTVLPRAEYPLNRVLDSKEPLVDLELGISQPLANTLTWVLLNAFPIFDEQRERIYSQWEERKINHIIITLTDITERKQATDELKRLKEFHETMIQNLAEGIIVSDVDGRIAHVNPVGARMLDHAAEDMLGQLWMNFVPPDQQAVIHAANARRKLGVIDRYELTLTHTDGSQLNLLVSGSPRFDGERFIGSMATFTDITGLVKTQNAVRESRRLLQSTLNALSAHIAILDETGTIIEVNAAWRRFADDNDLNDPTYGVGTNYLALCDAVNGDGEEDAAIVAAGIRSLLNQSCHDFYLEYSCHSPNEQRWFMLNMSCFMVGNDQRIAVAHNTITERKLAEDKERQQRMMADTLADVASTINQALDVEKVLEHIVNKIQYVVPHSGANLMLFDEEKAEAKIVRHCACYANNNLPEPRLGAVLTFEAVPNLKSIAEQGTPIAIPDVAATPDWVTTPTTEWIRSYACAPILIDKKVIGIINIDSDTPGTFTLLHAYQLQALADQAAIAIRNARLYQELESYSEFLEQAVAQRTEQLERSTENIESILNSSIDAVLLVQHTGIIQQANPTFDQWFGNPSGDVFGRRLVEIIRPDQVEHVMSALAAVFEHNQPQRIESVAQAEDGTYFDVDMAISPIRRHTGDVTNVVCSMRDITEFKQAEQVLEKRNLILTDLHLGTLEITSELEISVLLPRIEKRAVNLLNAERGGGIYLYDAENNILRLEAGSGINEERVGTILRPDEGVAGRVFQTKEPVIVNNYTQWEGRTTVLIPDPPSAVMGVPLFIQGQVVGTLLVIADSQKRIFTSDDVHLAEMFATQAAAAVHNARIYSTLKQEVIERKRTDEALRESEMRYRGIVEDQTELIRRSSPDGVITFVNEAYCRYFGQSSEELIGSHLMSPVPIEDQAELAQQLASLGPQNPIVVVEHRVIAAGSETRWAEWTDRMLFDAQGRGYQIQAVGRDITERKQAEERLKQTLAREMEISNMRMRFLSMASHDLRNPLAIIQSSVEMLSNYYDRLSDERKQDKFRQIRTGIMHMVELLDDVLIIGRAEAGKLTFTPEPVELETFCHNIIAEIQVSIGVNYTFNYTLTGERRVRLMDPKLLRHILYNLLSNAVKYSPVESTVTFELTYNEEQVIFRIQDEGIGIPETDQTRLFEPFHRASNVGVTKGTGLGLAIVKQSAELHGGTISYETQAGVGTTFTVVLPCPPT